MPPFRVATSAPGEPARAGYPRPATRSRRVGNDAHTQVVLCPGVNDGAALDDTVSELISHANVLSVGVVPVGASVDAEERAGQRGSAELDAVEECGRRPVRRRGVSCGS